MNNNYDYRQMVLDFIFMVTCFTIVWEINELMWVILMICIYSMALYQFISLRIENKKRLKEKKKLDDLYKKFGLDIWGD